MFPVKNVFDPHVVQHELKTQRKLCQNQEFRLRGEQFSAFAAGLKNGACILYMYMYVICNHQVKHNGHIRTRNLATGYKSFLWQKRNYFFNQRMGLNMIFKKLCRMWMGMVPSAA